MLIILLVVHAGVWVAGLFSFLVVSFDCLCCFYYFVHLIVVFGLLCTVLLGFNLYLLLGSLVVMVIFTIR